MEKKNNKLGAEHPSTLTSMHNLAWTWNSQGRNEEALRLMEECVRLQIRILGDSHPYTLRSREWLPIFRAES